ncbi:MATE family efflux transporter [Aquibacillus sp. 3ASR75-11]|uniref:MATE family efflux transporter n=1 Tax=Terrihalobacillus insolitus TaxID=2950438 RepID=A0A9X4AM51_9BACI|nr:MATE family efflux transporter [Terrihalobacillus insolitus]MDC3414383.1 MATE family efflux transporter [Terrihalobacillus insolitus]MDC3424464.1 MATE family efflux transporter [Terrihalobacillus insolitus]
MKKQQDFTSGTILKQLLFFSGPILLTNLLQVSYQFIDSLWVGNLLGANALGAVAVAGTVIFTMLSFIIGINNATLTILSQQKGKDNEEGLKRYLNAFVVILTVLSSILGLIGYLFSETILSILGTPDTMMALANTYLKINFLGILFLFGYNFIGTVLRALGDSKTPIRFVVIAVVLNAILDPIFITLLNFGISGAAYATIVSQGFSFFYGIYYVLRYKLVPLIKPHLPKKEEVYLILNLGIPSGLQMSVISAGVAAIMSVVTSFGEGVVGGFSAAQRIDSVIMLPAQALGTAVNSMAGQNIGVGKWKRVNQIAKYGIVYNLTIMLVIGTLVVILSEQMIRLFIQESEAVEFGTKYLQTIGLLYPFLGFNFILNGVVRAAGAMYQVLALNIVSFWILRYPLTFIFAKLFGDVGIAIGMGASFVLSSLIAFLYFRYGKWREKKLFKERSA